MANTLSSLSSAIGYTYEACVIAREGMPTLRRFAKLAGASDELLVKTGRLCAGKHPASSILARGRNKLAFHWDRELVERHVARYQGNKTLIWLQSNTDGVPVHTFADQVLASAMLQIPDSVEGPELKAAISKALGDVDSAMHIIMEFFSAATYGYLKTIRAKRRARKQGEAMGQLRKRGDIW
jgi:hypothetical protein